MLRTALLPPRRRRLPFVLAVVTALAVASPGAREARAQAPAARLQIGVGAIPGIGLQTGYVTPRSFYTIGGIGFLHATPRFAGGENDLQIGAAFGVALRPLGIVRTVANRGYTPYDIDLGVRLGPGLTFFGGDETLADKNKRFSLIFEPFVRATTDLTLGGTARTAYLEAGIQRPYLRAGLWLDL